MNLQDALNQSANRPAPGDVLIVVGSLEKDAGTDKVRIYPNPTSRNQYILLDAASVDGDVIDITDAYRKRSPALRASIFSVPVKTGSTLQLVTTVNVKVEDVAALGKLSVDQRGGGRCSCKKGSPVRGACRFSSCTTVDGHSYPCREEGPEGQWYCSNCCAVAGSEYA